MLISVMPTLLGQPLETNKNVQLAKLFLDLFIIRVSVVPRVVMS